MRPSPSPVLAALVLAAAPVAAPQAPSGAALERGLAAIDPAHIAADIHFIASDELRGRDTPSKEQRIAARYLRARVQRLGFSPGGVDGDFLYRYPLDVRRLDTEASFAGASGSVGLVFGTDYFFFNHTSLEDADVEGDIVFGGTGDREELDGLDEEALAGKWLLCVDSELSPLRLRNNVRRAGAAGLLVIPALDGGADPFPETFGDVARLCLRGISEYPRGGERRERSVFPQLFLGRAAALALVTALPARGDAAPETFRPAVGQDLGLRFHERRVTGGRVDVENVCALWPGSDPELAREVIVVSAHYDHVGADGDKIYNGADDNGSGTCGMLALAEGLARYGPMRRSVLLIWVSGEEKGLWGSRAWTQAPSLPEGSRAVCNLNIDMIGRNAPDYLLITPTSAHPEYNGLTRLAEACAPLEAFGELGSADAYWRRSDHANFAQHLDIPVAFLFSDVHEDYHKPTDTPDKIDYDKIGRVTRLVLRMLDGLQDDELKL